MAQVSPPVVQAPQVASQVVFLRNPGDAATILDYTQSSGLKLYEKATAAINPKFNGDPNDLVDFLRRVSERASSYGFTDQLMIPSDANAPFDDLVDITRGFANRSMEQCAMYAATYVNQQSRAAQNNYILVALLQDSMAKELRNRVLNEKNVFTVGGTVSGTCLLRHIIAKSSLDVQATVFAAHNALAKLDVYTATVLHRYFGSKG